MQVIPPPIVSDISSFHYSVDFLLGIQACKSNRLPRGPFLIFNTIVSCQLSAG
ncbi:MAG: hypothetical protein GDA43_25945 [Hormoscilla sp. SP5CHS1]|nr:hypothetical protein [Hormoscilla sp. SP12CHS1]MBC6456172.1 hypothetical protein [Hormoscilla sp. SP5CHS1]